MAIAELQSMFDAKPECGWGWSELHEETARHFVADKPLKHIEEIEGLIASGADVNAKTASGNTALHMAASSDHPKAKARARRLMKALIDAGADVNARNDFGYTPLHVARENGTAKLLLEKGADVNARNRSGLTPLHMAAWSKNIAMMTTFLAEGADPNASNKNGLTPMRFWQLGLERNSASGSTADPEDAGKTEEESEAEADRSGWPKPFRRLDVDRRRGMSR